MREIFTSGSVGGAPGNRCFYLEGDGIIARFTLVYAPKSICACILALSFKIPLLIEPLGLKEWISSGIVVGLYEVRFRKFYKQTCARQLFAWTNSLKGHALMAQAFRYPQRGYAWSL